MTSYEKDLIENHTKALNNNADAIRRYSENIFECCKIIDAKTEEMKLISDRIFRHVDILNALSEKKPL